MSNKQQIKQFKLVDVHIRNGITFTVLLNEKEMVQHHFELNQISKTYGGNK
jgi:hypothetical protein